MLKSNHFMLLVILSVSMAVCCSSGSTGPVKIKPIEDEDNVIVVDKDGMNVKGRVTDTDGKGIAGVVVSDGLQCTLTDDRGIFYLNSDPETVKNVFVVNPSEYEVPFGSGCLWNGFYKVSFPSESKSSVNVNFMLKKRTGDTDKYRILFMGDPQVMSSRPHSGESWKYVCNSLASYRQTFSGDLYQVFLGDMVVNEIEVAGKAESYLKTLSTSGISSFHIPGNHDHVQKATNYYSSIIEYSNWFGPYNYAVNLGKVHYIFLDDINWAYNGKAEYDQSLNSEAWSFLEADLQYVPKDTPLMISMHCPLTKSYGGKMISNATTSRLMKLLEGRECHFWYGHVHFYANWSYTDEELSTYASGVRSLTSYVVGRCGGAWCCSGEILRDGNPRGMIEIDVNGKDIRWQFKSFDSKYDDTMNCCTPGQFKGEGLSHVDDNLLYCNVYLWDNAWGNPELWAGGKKVADFTRVTGETYSSTYDPLYQHYYPIWKAQGYKGFREELSVEYDNMHLFSVLPPTGVKEATVKVKDRFGAEHSIDIKW